MTMRRLVNNGVQRQGQLRSDDSAADRPKRNNAVTCQESSKPRVKRFCGRLSDPDADDRTQRHSGEILDRPSNWATSLSFDSNLALPDTPGVNSRQGISIPRFLLNGGDTVFPRSLAQPNFTNGGPATLTPKSGWPCLYQFCDIDCACWHGLHSHRREDPGQAMMAPLNRPHLWVNQRHARIGMARVRLHH